MIKVELNPGETLCKQGDVSSDIYLLEDGVLEVFVRDHRGRDRRVAEISARHAIFGEYGAILKKPRGASIHAAQRSVVQKIETQNKGLDASILAEPRLGLSISLNLARYLKDTNLRLSQYTQLLQDIHKTANGFLLYYFKKAGAVGGLNEKNHLPWAKTIYDKAKLHGCFAMGEAVSKGQEVFAGELRAQAHVGAPPEIPSGLDNVKSFEKGEVIARETEEGREFYILQEGSLEIQVGGRKVSEVKEKGAVIGEVAALLGYASKKFETRSGSILAIEPSKVAVVAASGLQNLVSGNPNFILFITKVLSWRLTDTNQALLADDEKINKYLALIDASNKDAKTLINAFELLRTNLQSGAKDKAEAAGYAEEVQAKLSDLKETADSLQERYDELCRKWKTI